MHQIKRKTIFLLVLLILLNPIVIKNSISHNNGYEKNNEFQQKNQFSSPQLITSTKIENTNASYPQHIEYLIITPKQFVNNFQPLINYKSQYMNATIITLEEILQNKKFWVNGTFGDATNNTHKNPWIPSNEIVTTNFTIFNDTSAKIRNFIRFAHTEWNTQFVLLGGDAELIPPRRLYGYISNWSNGKTMKPIQAHIVSDHYYAALNGTWNDDYDANFGEEAAFSIRDEADFTAEVYIGRAPVNDNHEVSVFVDKVILYETSKKPNDILLHQSYINPEHIPDTTTVTNHCKRWIPEKYNIHTLYEKDETVTQHHWINAFSNPEKLLVFHVGNGHNNGIYSWYQLSWDEQKRVKFNVFNTGSLSNSFYPIHLSISCLTGDFTENECLAEELLLTRNGGPSACIANSEVGCILPTNASMYSGEFFEEIFKNLFDTSIHHLGEKIQRAKEHFSTIAQNYRQYRWCFYEINLLGDPETPIFQSRQPSEQNNHTVIVDHNYSSSTSGWNKTRFKTIQSAIDHVNDHTSIIINNGTYYEQLRINTTINLIGVNNSKVILTNKKDTITPLIELSCHSTLIKNITIKHNNSAQKNSESLIHMLPECNGNHIKNNILKGPSTFGILITDSIRNTIEHNVIKNCRNGIGVINDLGGLLPTKVIVTCDNIISHNYIEYYAGCGIIIKGSIHNYIEQNTFINTPEFSSQKDYFFFNQHIHLENTKLNEIKSNYYNEEIKDPYPINSLSGPITIFSIDFSRGIVLWYFKCILILNIGYPTTVFDPSPLQSPQISTS